VKESAVGNSDSASRQVGAVLKDSKRPCRPTFVSLPPKFVHAILDAGLRHLLPLVQATLSSSCKYHTHDTSRTCYKSSVQLTIMRREEKLELNREKSRKDLGEVLKNAESNDVETADWEKRTAEAKRAWLEQRRYVRVGFHRLNEQRPIDTEGMRGTAVATLQKHHELPDTSGNVQAGTCTSCNVFGTALKNGAIDDILNTTPAAHRLRRLLLKSCRWMDPGLSITQTYCLSTGWTPRFCNPIPLRVRPWCPGPA
jgi:hypothetical protein